MAPALAAEPDAQREKIEWKKPIVYSLGLMGVGITALVLTNEADDDPHFSNFKDAFETGPKHDDDGAGYNFVLHPLWGSETYLRAREANMNILGSIGFSFAASVTWEYFVESWTEHPSSSSSRFPLEAIQARTRSHDVTHACSARSRVLR